MMEVRSEELSNMRGLIQREKQNMLLEMHGRNAGQQRPRRGMLGPCRAIPGQAGSLPTASGIDAKGGAAAERRAPRGNQTANEGVGL